MNDLILKKWTFTFVLHLPTRFMFAHHSVIHSIDNLLCIMLSAGVMPKVSLSSVFQKLA